MSGDLLGCPGAEHFEWLLDSLRQGADLTAPSDVALHAIPPGSPGDFAAALHSRSQRAEMACAEVVGWRVGRTGQPVVTYRSSDGRDWDLSAALDESGRLIAGQPTRSSNGVDVEVGPTADLSAEVLNSVRRVFQRCYEGADLDWFDDRLGRLRTIGVGWLGDAVVGFCAQAVQEIDLGPIGKRNVFDTGLLCTDPDLRVRGAGSAIGNQTANAIVASTGEVGIDLQAPGFATPVMLNTFLTTATYTWPGNSIEEVAEVLSRPTPTQRTVGALIANKMGADGFDADHWVMRFAEGHGETNVVPKGLHPAFAELFQHVDQSAGDRLLVLFWPTGSEPPSAWFK